jgi:hypothetical protein
LSPARCRVRCARIAGVWRLCRLGHCRSLVSSALRRGVVWRPAPHGGRVRSARTATPETAGRQKRQLAPCEAGRTRSGAPSWLRCRRART